GADRARLPPATADVGCDWLRERRSDDRRPGPDDFRADRGWGRAARLLGAVAVPARGRRVPIQHRAARYSGKHDPDESSAGSGLPGDAARARAPWHRGGRMEAVA